MRDINEALANLCLDLNLPEHQDAFAVDVPSAFPHLAESYEKTCPKRTNLIEMGRKARRCQYSLRSSSVDEIIRRFMKDIQLIHDNCIRFNPQSAGYISASKKLLEMAKERTTQIQAEWKDLLSRPSKGDLKKGGKGPLKRPREAALPVRRKVEEIHQNRRSLQPTTTTAATAVAGGRQGGAGRFLMTTGGPSLLHDSNHTLSQLFTQRRSSTETPGTIRLLHSLPLEIPQDLRRLLCEESIRLSEAEQLGPAASSSDMSNAPRGITALPASPAVRDVLEQFLKGVEKAVHAEFETLSAADHSPSVIVVKKRLLLYKQDTYHDVVWRVVVPMLDSLAPISLCYTDEYRHLEQFAATHIISTESKNSKSLNRAEPTLTCDVPIEWHRVLPPIVLLRCLVHVPQVAASILHHQLHQAAKTSAQPGSRLKKDIGERVDTLMKRSVIPIVEDILGFMNIHLEQILH